MLSTVSTSEVPIDSPKTPSSGGTSGTFPLSSFCATSLNNLAATTFNISLSRSLHGTTGVNHNDLSPISIRKSADGIVSPRSNSNLLYWCLPDKGNDAVYVTITITTPLSRITMIPFINDVRNDFNKRRNQVVVAPLNEGWLYRSFTGLTLRVWATNRPAVPGLLGLPGIGYAGLTWQLLRTVIEIVAGGMARDGYGMSQFTIYSGGKEVGRGTIGA
ncbi:hypothetical protein MMC06_004856 [Schaereria dolodes]|nr:hypothetical protein [Schaereria dolodes]